VLVLGDLHAGNKKPFSTVMGGGLNSRFSDSLRVLSSISDYVSGMAIRTLVFLGDIFEAPGPTIHKDVLIWVHNSFKRIADKCEQVFIVSGNHDYFRDKSVLTVFDDISNVRVISEPETY